MLKQKKERLKTRQGFSLIELVTVMIIVAILAAFSIINVDSNIDKARLAAIKNNMESVYTAANLYYAEKGTASGLTCAKLQTAGYIAKCPTGPDTNVTYAISVTSAGNLEITYTGTAAGKSVTYKMSEMK